jgi:tetratricopeptide (TPR) repeat protein
VEATIRTTAWERAIKVVLVCFCAWFAGAAGLSAQQDKILLKNGKDRQVRIKSEDFDGLRYTTQATGSAETKVAWSEIDSIEYSGGKDYQDALATFGAGRWAEALSKLDALAGNADLRPVMRQGVLYHGAVANLRLGKPDEALAKYTTLLQEFPKSRYLLPVGQSLLSIYLAKDDATGAARALEPVLAASKDAASDEALGAALGVLRGRLLEEQKQYDEAEKAYTGATRAAKADPDVITGAKLGLARCAQKRGQAGEAERSFRELAAADAPNSLLAGAWNGLGDIALEAATSKRDVDGLRVALLSYLRGVVLYVPGPGEVSDEYERSLAGASKSFKAIGELEANADRKKNFLDRSRQCKDQLASRFPSSRFLKGL